jgi:L-malate glycosyltransferase
MMKYIYYMIIPKVMRIALVYDMIYPYSIGGVETRNYDLASELVRRGHEVHYFCIRSWSGDRHHERNGIKIHGLSRLSGRGRFSGHRRHSDPLRFTLALSKIFDHDLDIVDCTAFPYLPAFMCASYCLKRKVPLVMTWHEVWDRLWSEQGTIGFPGKVAEKAGARLTRHNICVSSNVRSRLESIGQGNGTVIPNWVHQGFIDDVAPSATKSDIIYFGRIIRHKNILRLLKLVSILKSRKGDIKAVIVGEGPELPLVLKAISHLGLEKNVDIHPFFTMRESVYSLVKSSKLFVLLSSLEGFSIASLESLACGTPVLTMRSETNAATELITHGRDGYVCEDSDIEIMDTIHKHLKDRKKKDMAPHCIQKAKGYDFHLGVDKIESFYRHAVSKPK